MNTSGFVTLTITLVISLIDVAVNGTTSVSATGEGSTIASDRSQMYQVLNMVTMIVHLVI